MERVLLRDRERCGVLIGELVDDLSFHLLPAANLVPAIGQTAFDRLAIGLAGGPDGVRRVGGAQHHAVRRWAERGKPSWLHAHGSSLLGSGSTGLKIVRDRRIFR